MIGRFSCVCLAAMVLLVGCGQQATVDPESLAIRKVLLIDQSPGESITISAAKLSVHEKKGSQAQVDVVITGYIDANGHDPWESDKAVFVVTDASEEYLRVSKAHNHDDGDCPFCKHKSEPNQFMALVQIVDEQGNLFQRSAKGILGLQTKQTVVIQGQGSINDEDMLVVVTKGIFVSK